MTTTEAQTIYTTYERAMVFHPAITFEEWAGLFHSAQRQRITIKWWLLDALKYGLEQWGEDAWGVVQSHQLSRHTWENYLRIVRVFGDPDSRQWHVTLSHYAAVCPDDIPWDQKCEFLATCEREGLSVEELRAMIREWRDEPEPQDSERYTFDTRGDEAIAVPQDIRAAIAGRSVRVTIEVIGE